MQETWVRSQGQEDPLEKEMATHSSIPAWRIPKDRGAWRVTVHSVAKSRAWLTQLSMHTKYKTEPLSLSDKGGFHFLPCPRAPVSLPLDWFRTEMPAQHLQHVKDQAWGPPLSFCSVRPHGGAQDLNPSTGESPEWPQLGSRGHLLNDTHWVHYQRDLPTLSSGPQTWTSVLWVGLPPPAQATVIRSSASHILGSHSVTLAKLSNFSELPCLLL